MKAEAHQIRIVGGAQFTCSEEERVLFAMERSGLDEIGVGCRGGGCGFCRVRVVEGKYRTGKMSTAKVTAADQAQGYALACRLYPLNDLLIEVG
ncbi:MULTISPECIES: 2Fe-2S iron-sulfur cluster-binding protein [Novosphingobium]|jgi:ferredoxin|uniref:Putative ferredoxin n=1 Tax=Novosphingobium subterraneum TaxID=48936 RepID=A0A0B8ZC59_9SPHN|nr:MULTISPECIES: 2Fe-2S iron-sulfur cluster-binding protein [Novosphingobium]KHS43827.1 putative ferredoxin [Novosphingobium subterraneum]NBS64973.1 ferredoxin [Betaproteobacteria bacterium]QOV96713.1 2Fe-2S iron-sulfur cluster binding domain-containing protein [Novosphingobium sp. ES2-1]